MHARSVLARTSCIHVPFLSVSQCHHLHCFRLCLTMKRKAKKKKLVNEGGASGSACAPARDSPIGQARTSSSRVTANWNDLSASQAISLGGGLASRHEEGSPPKAQHANPFARPSVADPSQGRFASTYPRAFSASNVQSSRQTFVTSRVAAHSMVGLEELSSRLYSSQSNAQLSANPFLQREPQQNQTFTARNVTYRESFHPGSHERIRFGQEEMLPALEFQPTEGVMSEIDGGGISQAWLPYQQQGANHLQDGVVGVSSISSSSLQQANQHHSVVAPSMAAHPAEFSSSSPRVGTSDTMLSSSSGGDDWSPGDPADELSSGVSAHQLPLGAMSPLHFGEDEANFSTD
jgi:hypothetical protein